MYDFFVLIANFWQSIINLFDEYKFGIGPYSVSYFSIVFAFLAISLVISVFWKGAKS